VYARREWGDRERRRSGVRALLSRDSTNPNNYNKSYLNCPFQPGTALQITKAVTPTVALPNQVTPVTYTIAVQNGGTRSASGVVVEDQAIPTFLTNVAVQVTTDDPDVVLPTPASLPVKASTLGAGRHLTVEITRDATPSCTGGDFVNTASVQATNAFENQASATLGGCVPCTTAADCSSDGNACTTETCSNGVCSHEPVAGCMACTTAADCPSDNDACTTGTCNAGVCQTQQIDGCTLAGSGGTGNPGGTSNPGAGNCQSGDCSHAGGHVAEVCGDCQDNDGDGLVDYEDPDCCQQIDPLTLARLVLRKRPQAAADSLRLRAVPSPPARRA
jgi:uncharacterized repeat protein (TIGR01451 family)